MDEDDDSTVKPVKVKHVPVPESAHVLAIRALRAISKSSTSSLQITEVPSELLFGEQINYQVWSLILNDKNLKELSEQKDSGKQYYLNASSSHNISDLFKTFWSPLKCSRGIITLDLTNSKSITDYGLTLVLRNNVNLESINISKCTMLTDVSIREIGLNCTNVQNINLSSCYEIDGYGLVSIAECCHNLLKLNISKCKKIQKYSITKIFYHCTRLEEVNVSYLKEITDEEIRVLSQNCPNLLTLVAAECMYLSDQSVLYISQNCADIDFIDISRTAMAFRITDVTLSALGQKAFTLRVLKVSGCEQLSDVGLTWLAEGCKAITELDLSRCTRITDAGLRNIGKACHSLTSLDISHARTVTDVGVSSLSAGCPHLKHLKCHGAFLLSDPRLSAPTKGAKLESWQSIIGVAALANNCHNVETLDLSGCFRLNIALHSYISTLSRLRELNLTGCNQSSSEAMEAVAKGCTLLEDLTLTDCGKSVNNKSVKAFASNCKNLHTLILVRCDFVKGGAIKAIAHFCHNLTKLDLSQCKLLTDSYLLYLCEVNKVDKLRTLNLVDVPLLTDSILAWLSIKSHNILSLALKGTSITRKAIMSVRDRYPNSDMVYNENFIGFHPKYRVNDRILINKYYNAVTGIIKIQSKLRVQMAKEVVKNIVHTRKVLKSRCLIQRVVRGFLGRCVVYHKKARILLVNRSAVKITSIFRRVVALKVIARKRAIQRHILKHNKTIMIQLCFRKHRDYKRLLQLREKRAKYQQMRVAKATMIQSIGRMYFAKNRVARIKLMRRKKLEVANRKATMIQRCFRGYVARQITNTYKEFASTLEARRLKAVLRIQYKVRSINSWAILNAKVERRRYILRCCVKVQALMRGALARIHVAELMTERYEIRKGLAAIKIQGRLRMLKAIMEMKRRVRIKLTQRRNHNEAANKIIRQARMKIAVIRMRRRHEERQELRRRKANLEIQSAVKIQALQRGIKGREMFVSKLKERKGKWKELYDEKLQKRFFYNKLSGEIRYRMPQDLLDLIPFPTCDNCAKQWAIVECSVCSELFCQSCFNNVHSGGRRKDHPFRALYDYYNKRLDYGDGCFPCKWPSEVMQDEVQGWMLRIAPVRNPVKSYPELGWEVYNENTKDVHEVKHSANYHKLHNTFNTSGNSGENRLFYFNRNTFETTYDVPAEIQQIHDREALRTANNTIVYNTGYYDENNMWIDNTRPNTYAHSFADYDGAGTGIAYDYTTVEESAEQFDMLDYHDQRNQQPYNTSNLNSNYSSRLNTAQYSSRLHTAPQNTSALNNNYMGTNTTNNTNASDLRGINIYASGNHNYHTHKEHYASGNNPILNEHSLEYRISDDNSTIYSVPSQDMSQAPEDGYDLRGASPYNNQYYESAAQSPLDKAAAVGVKKRPTIVPKKLF